APDMTSFPPAETAARPAGPPRGLLGLMVTMFLVFLFSGGVLLYLLAKGRKATPPAPGPGAHVVQPPPAARPSVPDEFVSDFYIPPFQLVDQDEKPVTNAAFEGRITVISFFFTHCPF